MQHAIKRRSSPKVVTVPVCSTSGRPIRAHVIRAMEEQQRASQKAMDALHELTELVKDAKNALLTGAPVRAGE